MYKSIQNIFLLAAATLAGTALAAPATAASIPAPALRASAGEDYMDVVTKWRVQLGVPPLAESATLVRNAQKTVIDANGQMVHEMNPGTMAQVLAGGAQEDFEHAFVGGWLCEIPTMPGLNGVCDTELGQGYIHDGSEIRHAQIVSSTKYTQIGCAWAMDVWGCDFA